MLHVFVYVFLLHVNLPICFLCSSDSAFGCFHGLFWVPVIFIQRLVFLGNIPERLSPEAWVENKVWLSGGILFPVARCLDTPSAVGHVKGKVVLACLGHRDSLKGMRVGTAWMGSLVTLFFL